ncbi:MAG: DUF305 domain-containing protein [Candidatus Nanopelagicaceae bacterium]|nr:DUF305 domain-containing protein [Candidatus Nanopelagicaceae bacterium]
MNISKKSAGILALVLVITSGFFAYALLNPNNPMQMGAMDHGSSHSSTAAQTLSADDAMFLQMMIPHHAQAVVIAEYALTNSKNEQVLKIAKQIKSDQAGEITQMKKWLTDDGLGTDAGHSMAGMSGMLNDSQLNTLKSSKGGGFDKLFLNNMIEHHQGALQMVGMIENSKVAALRDFATAISTAQQAEIDQMQKLLGN